MDLFVTKTPLFHMILKLLCYVKHIDLICLENRFQFGITENLPLILWILKVLLVISIFDSYMSLDIVPYSFSILQCYIHRSFLLRLDYMNLSR